jgi:signal transduction histidine kinase/DNA-binding response OmpR family regulator
MNRNVWPSCDGEAAELVRELDWAATPLGPLAHWPGQLRTLVDVVLRTPAPTALMWGEAGTMIYNDGYGAVCGSRHPRVFGCALHDAWPEAWDFNGDMLARCRRGESQFYQSAHFVLERDGQLRDAWFDLYYSPVVGPGGEVDGVLATVIETTHQVQAEQVRAAHEGELRRLNDALDTQRARLEATNHRLAGDMAFLNSLFQLSPSFMAVLLGPDHVYELTNSSYDRLIQHRDVRGKALRDALPEVAEQGFCDVLDEVYRSGEPFHGRHLEVMLERADGQGVESRMLDFVYQPLTDQQGRVYGIFVVGIDVTAHALAEERLRVAQEAGEIGTFEWYPERGELIVSDMYRRLWGLPADAPVTAHMLVALVDPGYRQLSGVSRLGQSANPLEYAEYPIIRADTGERRWVARKGQAVGGSGQEGTRYLGVAYDITDRKHAELALRDLNESLERRVSSEVAERVKAEDALRQAQKMEAVGQLASGVAHDFNNVLQVISSNLQLMELDAGATALLRSRLGHAVAAVERGSKLSSQLLAFARRQPLQPVVTHLGQLLRNIEPLLQRALGDAITLALEVEPGLWSTAVDPNQIENAILNMAINARDAMQGIGRLAIAVRNHPARPLGEATGRRADHVALSVTDTGCGMPPEVLAKVFEPFYTTKDPGKGTGLGLSMVYGFVKQSGGEIHIDSAPGLGTTITIELPRTDDAALAPEHAARAALRGGDETVLVVEDDAAVRAAAVDMLDGLGYRVLKAGNGEQALELLQSGTPIDLLFTDVSMPGPVDGVDLVARAALLAPATAVLLTSGQALDRSRLEGRMPPGIELLPKPYRLAQLAQAIRHELDKQKSAPPTAACDDGEPRDDNALLHFLVVEDDRDARELACEMLAALGHRAQGAASAEHALELLASSGVDVLFTDLHLPGMAGDELAARASAAAPGLAVILASGEGIVPVRAPHCEVVMLPKPYDLMQLQLGIAAIERARAGKHALPAAL